MELKAFVKVGLVVFLMGLAATTDARYDSSSFITQVLTNGGANYRVKSTSTACCDNCVCTKSDPPQCECHDVRDLDCHSGCENCVCMWKYPPVCVCNDVTDFCYDKCDSSKANNAH
ncbi:unnamed protein product [Sphenostylis stenocarpa]|uniref:Bowman-Birk serine protease inhibitors family domain-containing protein n=1 Tax=Sphenostylis stenocarpa TaxID=92480 RepID=A0AA86RUH6_9FABA|nr:unnamed protein product [Sphenostylis stenocarpa]